MSLSCPCVLLYATNNLCLHHLVSVYTEVAPGAPQERTNDSMISEGAEAAQLRERLLEVEQSLADERARRETAEEALRLSEDRAKR